MRHHKNPPERGQAKANCRRRVGFWSENASHPGSGPNESNEDDFATSKLKKRHLEFFEETKIIYLDCRFILPTYNLVQFLNSAENTYNNLKTMKIGNAIRFWDEELVNSICN